VTELASSISGRALCFVFFSLASTFRERGFGDVVHIPAEAEEGSQTSWRMITLLRETVDAVVAGLTFTACLPPAMASLPPLNLIQKNGTVL